MSVYTKINLSELKTFLSHYNVGEVIDLKGISDGIENTNYFVTTELDGKSHQFVLTIFEQLDHTELPYFLNLMAHLAEHKVPSAHPIADTNNTYLQTLKNKPAALVERLAGSSNTSPNQIQCAQIGDMLAKLHIAGQSFTEQRTNPRGADWRETTGQHLLPKLDDADQALLKNELAFQAKATSSADLPAGVIHADLFKDNALFVNDSLTGIIDFYYACHDTFIYDIAVTVNDWCSKDNGELNQTCATTFLTAYHKIRPLTQSEKDMWPTMLRAAALRFWLSRLHDMHFPREGELTHIKDPNEFKRILINRSENEETLQNLWPE